MPRPFTQLALTTALLLVSAGNAQSELGLRLEAAAKEAHPAIRLVEEAVAPANGARYALLVSPTHGNDLPAILQGFLRAEFADGTEPFQFFAVIFASGRYTAVRAARNAAGGDLIVGGSIAWNRRGGLEHEYGVTRLLAVPGTAPRAASPATPTTAPRTSSAPRPAASSRPRGTPNSSSYTSTERSSTFIMFGPTGLATYRQACTFSMTGGTFRSNCVDTTW